VAVLKKYDLTGKELESVTLDEKLLESAANPQMIKDYLIALRRNARQWSANTKTRAEVAHSGKKPHPQKGTGRARQGYLGAPQYKGGGRVHAPRPKFDQHVRQNKKERRAAIRHLIIEKIRDDKVRVLHYASLKKPQTKKVAEFLSQSQLDGKRVLFLVEGGEKKKAGHERYHSLRKSMDNIPKLELAVFSNVDGYDLALHQELIVLEPAVDELMTLLKRGAK
jgi:large subunit ribosomal protein L4